MIPLGNINILLFQEGFFFFVLFLVLFFCFIFLFYFFVLFLVKKNKWIFIAECGSSWHIFDNIIAGVLCCILFAGLFISIANYRDNVCRRRSWLDYGRRFGYLQCFKADPLDTREIVNLVLLENILELELLWILSRSRSLKPQSAFNRFTSMKLKRRSLDMWKITIILKQACFQKIVLKPGIFLTPLFGWSKYGWYKVIISWTQFLEMKFFNDDTVLNALWYSNAFSTIIAVKLTYKSHIQNLRQSKIID